jgi:DNA-binding transcriptional LysR family regulator
MNDAAEFRHFRYLLAVAEQKGFRAAAEKLNTSQPALSRQAKEFQEAFQIELFQKTKSGRIRLTRTGVAFIAIAHDLLDARDEAIAALICIQQQQSSVLRLGFTSFADEEICRVACEFHKQLSPACAIRPSIADTTSLLNELAADEIDAAIVTLPVNDERLQVEKIREDPMVVCIRADHPLAAKPLLTPSDLEANLRILGHPGHHPLAHQRLMEMLSEIGIVVNEHARASHPHETQTLVKNGFGFGLLREGTPLQPDLTTRRIAGVNWAVDTAIVFKKATKVKTLPILARNLRRRYGAPGDHALDKKQPDRVTHENGPVQLSLLG